MVKFFASLFSLIVACLISQSAFSCDGGSCANGLAYEAFGPKDRAAHLVVFIHGSVSSGGPADYFYSYAEKFAEKHRNVEAVAILMPGYYDHAGKRSDGSDNGRRTFEATEVLNGALIELKARYQSKDIYAIGHSNGAMNIGGLLGKYPQLIQGAVLVSGIYDLNAISQMRGKRYSGISGQDLIANISPSTSIIAVHGTQDTTVPYVQSQNYIAAANAAKLKAKLITVENVDHNFSGPLANEAMLALNSLVK